MPVLIVTAAVTVAVTSCVTRSMIASINAAKAAAFADRLLRVLVVLRSQLVPAFRAITVGGLRCIVEIFVGVGVFGLLLSTTL